MKEILKELLVRDNYKFKNIKYTLSGIFFTIFVKKYKKDGVILHVPFDMTDFRFRGRFILNKYEVEEAEHLYKYLPKDAKVLELGSCLGYVSCLINKKLKNKTDHVALEANPNLIPWIEKNRATNACSYSIENSIISKQEENTFYIHDLIVGGSTKRKTPNKVTIKGVTIEFLEKKHNIEFDTLVMDIEGGELGLLKDFQDRISKFQRIFMEVHPFANILTKEEAKECEDILLKLGFTLLVRDGYFQIWKKKSM